MPNTSTTIRITLKGSIAFLFAANSLFALEEVTGLNLSADENLGARRAGFALKYAGKQKGADGALNTPASLNDVDDFSFSTYHAERFGLARFDHVAMVLPWHATSTLGLGLSRYSVSNIEKWSEITPGGVIPNEPEGVFSTSDWVVSGAFARRYGNLDIGGSMHLLYRQLDQRGLGLRADAMTQFNFDTETPYRLGAYLRGLVPSAARWESGRSEYESPELSLFGSGTWNFPYFYGQLQMGFETPGLFQIGGKSSQDLAGKRTAYSPAMLIKNSHLGGEFDFNFGLALRMGLEGLNPSDIPTEIRLGAGYSWRGILGVDYAFAPHAQLENSHRLAMQWTPSFPRFEGRKFRPKVQNIKGSIPITPINPKEDETHPQDILHLENDTPETKNTPKEPIETGVPVQELLEVE